MSWERGRATHRKAGHINAVVLPSTNFYVAYITACGRMLCCLSRPGFEMRPSAPLDTLTERPGDGGPGSPGAAAVPARPRNTKRHPQFEASAVLTPPREEGCDEVHPHA
ncbi:hypothetical protein TNCT1_26230 [Streptomyces sp. 1-11]|nr:hypothetical protein TNCT1_26230 [Streptomyces sp. 1-11]